MANMMIMMMRSRDDADNGDADDDPTNISPQLELIKNTTEDCTASYSTGNFTCLMVVFKFRFSSH